MLEIFVLLSILSAVLGGISIAMERKGLSQLPEITPGRSARNPLRVVRTLVFCRLWLFGWIIGQISWAFAVQSFYIGDFNVVKAVGSMSIVVATILSVQLLGERLNSIEKLGIILVTVGTVLVSLQSQVTKQGTIDLVVFTIFNSVALAIAFTLMLVAGVAGNRGGSSIWEATSATAAGIFYSVSAIFQYFATYGAGGGQKEFSIFSIESWLGFILNVPFVVGYSITLLGFFSFQSAMSRGRASIAYPISASLGVALPVLGSVLIFGEMIVVPLDASIQFPLSYLRLIGIVVVIIGGVLVQTHSWRSLVRRKKTNVTGSTEKGRAKEP